MARRFNLDFYDPFDNRYYVEINDEQYVGVSTEVRCTSAMLEYEPQNGDKVYTPIIAATFTIELFLSRTTSTGVAIAEMLVDMAQEQEGRFWAVVREYGSLNNVFIGYLVVEDVRTPNKSITTAALTFTDGLAKTESLDYKDNLGQFFDPNTTETLWKHLVNCLSLMPIRSKYLSSARFIEVLIDWTHTDQLYITHNSLNRTRVPHSKFTSVKDDGSYETMNVFDVIVEILKPYYATLAYLPNPDGNYILTHFDKLISNTLAPRVYYNTNFQAVLIEEAKDNTNTGATDMSTGNYGFLPGLKCVNMNFKYDRNPLAPDVSSIDDIDYTELLRLQVTSSEEKIIAWGKISTIWQSISYINWGAKGVFNLAIKVESATITRWWQQDDTVALEPSGWMRGSTSISRGWTTVESFATVRTSEISWHKGQKNFNDLFINIVSDSLADDIDGPFNIGDELTVSLKFSFYARERDKFSPSLVEGVYTILGFQRTLYTSVIENGSSDNIQTTGLSIKGLFDENNSKKQKYDISLGYGQNASKSNLEIQNTANEWVTATNEWGISEIGGDSYLYELILGKLYSLRKSTMTTYEGVFIGPQVWGMRMFTMPHGDFEQLFPVSGSHDLGLGTFAGKYIEQVVNVGSPVITIENNTTSSDGSSTNTGTTPNTATVPTSTGSVNLPKIPFGVTGLTSTSFLISGTKVVDDVDFEYFEMQLFIYLQRGNVILTYNKDINNLGRSEYKASIQGSDTLITLGRITDIEDIFTGWIIAT